MIENLQMTLMVLGAMVVLILLLVFLQATKDSISNWMYERSDKFMVDLVVDKARRWGFESEKEREEAYRFCIDFCRENKSKWR